MLQKAERNASDSRARKSHYEKEIAYDSEKLKKLQEEFTKIKEMTFDKSKTVCPVCQSEFAEDKKVQLNLSNNLLLCTLLFKILGLVRFCYIFERSILCSP